MNSGKYVEVTGDKKRQITQVEAHELNKKKSMMNDGNILFQLTLLNKSDSATQPRDHIEARPEMIPRLLQKARTH